VSKEAQRDCAVLSPMKLCERHAKEYARAAELTDDPVFRNMLLTLALQWVLAAQEEASTASLGL
jgi:hypothetical protein